MKRVNMGIAAAVMLAAGGPAAAQGGYQTQDNRYQTPNGQGQYQQNGNGANGNLSARIDQLRVRIQTGVQSGAISQAEAQPLRQQLRALTQLERQYGVNGLTGQERSDLQQRLRNLRQQVRTADGGAQGRYDREEEGGGYGDGQNGNGQYGNGQYGNGQYGNGQYGNSQNGNGQNGNGQYGQGGYDRVDRDRDGYDDRDYNRDGRVNDDAYQQPAQRGGLGGIIDRVIGGGALRVGQRASGNLYALPSEYRGQYRDSGDGYFRTDGRQIYQIDARSQTVVRIYPMR